jgi:hypothetical protein
MRTATMSRHEDHPVMRQTTAGEPGQVAVTVIACLVILLVFVVIAVLV